MHFTVEKEIFLKGLTRVQGIVEKRNTIPILANVLIEANENGINMTATDLEVGMKAFYPATVKKTGKITVSAKKLYEITKELPEKEISFLAKENCWVEIRCGKAIFNIVGLSADEFPYFPYPEKENFISIKSNIIKEMVDKTYFSISTDETKYNLNGIYFKTELIDNKSKLLLIATDGHRLSMISKEMKDNSENEMLKGVIFPKKGIYELKKISDEDDSDISIGFMDNNAVVKKGKTIVIMRLVDGEFPDYNRVIPKQNEFVAKIKRDDFNHSLRRMAILSNEKSKGIKLTLKTNYIEISSSNPEFGDAREELEVEYSGPELSIGYNARYIMDVLQNQDCEKIELHIKDNLSPGILKAVGDNDYLAVIMPMRL
ncbi:DNA polymerase III subunit beta [Trichloromonas sp.]|uniref:DNA polymerase III subunit beta n=1 Tax=Trichloromonas sp. TaxID=3069249 RepID=UPI003D818A4D